MLSSPPALVLQFGCHCDHPVRDRPRGLLQLAVIVDFAAHFSVGLVCSALWIDNGLEYVWLGYQLYVMLAMHVARYWPASQASTAESGLIRHLGEGPGPGCGHCGRRGAVLFGHERLGPSTVKVRSLLRYATGVSREALRERSVSATMT